MMELVKTHFFNLILHVRRVIQVQIDTSRLGVRCPDLIGNAGGQYMFFLYLFYRLRLSKVSQSVSNKSYLILHMAKKHNKVSLCILWWRLLNIRISLLLMNRHVLNALWIPLESITFSSTLILFKRRRSRVRR